ncbi:hypothetical protein AB4Y45_32695 [Paraburkholderia sp. EG287A]|uniref:hypothetical protein n=1 Tax=Paraburkholderia sp. EG287A TaxID=3237012 RepID=UPI0034D2F956
MRQKSKLDVWAEAHPRIFWGLILGVAGVVSAVCLPGLAPEGCRSWQTMFSCKSLPPFWSLANLKSGALYLAIIVGVPAVFARIRSRMAAPQL